MLKNSRNSLKFRVREFNSPEWKDIECKLQELGFQLVYDISINGVEIIHETKEDSSHELMVAKSLVFNHFPGVENNSITFPEANKEWGEIKTPQEMVKHHLETADTDEVSSEKTTEDEESQEDLEEDNSEESATDVDVDNE